MPGSNGFEVCRQIRESRDLAKALMRRPKESVMQLSVEVNRQEGKCVFLCRGGPLLGEASDYLFHLLTRSHRKDVILDLAASHYLDRAGLHIRRHGISHLYALQMPALRMPLTADVVS